MAQCVFQPFTSDINVAAPVKRRAVMSQAEVAKLFGRQSSGNQLLEKDISLCEPHNVTAFANRLSGWQDFLRAQ